VRLQLGRWRLRAAVATVIGAATLAGSARAQEAKRESTVDEHVAFEYGQYADTDHVFVETPSVSGTVSDPIKGWSVGGQYLVDVVSAASVDIVSTASRRWNEVRQEGGLQASYKPQALGAQASATISDEPDYLSLSAGGAITQDLANKNVTWLFGYAYGHDVAGRTGTPF
jgi:hypothetical protein